MEEFSCLSELGKYSKGTDSRFQNNVAEFFWEIIVSSGSKNRELVDNCIKKYRDMIKYWDLARKLDIFSRLLKSIGDPATHSIPCLKLFQGLIQDQDDRTAYSSSTTSTYPSAGASAQTAT